MAEYEHEGPTDQEIEDTYSSAWKYVLNEVARAYFRTWLAAHDARVHREGARGALDGLTGHSARLAEAGLLGAGTAKIQRAAAVIATEYRDTHYPETEDQT